MGVHSSKAAGRLAGEARSAEIDRLLEEEKKGYKKKIYILLFGSDESGVQAIVNQMKFVHRGGSARDELESYRSVVYENVLDSARALILALHKLGIDRRQVLAKIVNYQFDFHAASYLSPDITAAIHELWRDPIVSQVTAENDLGFYPLESMTYFLSEVLRIGSPDYLPTKADILHLKSKNSGIRETKIHMGQLSICMYDVNNRLSKKWVHHFERVTSVIFCVALSDYDQVSVNQQNRLYESLVMFESVINSRWFLRTSIILLLTQIDRFKEKLPRVPLQQYFPEYTGGNDVNKAAKFILWRFMQANRARLSVYPHLARVDDPSNITLVFSTIKETILQNALKDSGRL